MTKRTKYDSRLTVLCPAELLRAINTAAAAKLQRPAEYVRAAIFARLQADGIAIGTPSLDGPTMTEETDKTAVTPAAEETPSEETTNVGDGPPTKREPEQ